MAVGRERLLAESVFSVLSADTLAKLLGGGVNEPEVVVDITRDVKLVGWLHPGLTGGGWWRLDPAAEAFMPVTEDAGVAWQETAKEIRDGFLQLNVEEIDSKKAIGLANAAGISLDGLPRSAAVSSPELFHNFADIPSPTHLLGRSLSYVQMWQVDSPEEISDSELDSLATVALPEGFNLKSEVGRGPVSNLIFVKTVFNAPCSPRDPTSQCMFTDHALSALDSVRARVLQHWPDASLDTLEFWTVDVGFRFEAGQLVGNPFVVSDGVKHDIPDGLNRSQVGRWWDDHMGKTGDEPS